MASTSSAATDQGLKAKAKKLFDPRDPTPMITLINNLFSTDTTLRSNADILYNFSKKDYPNALTLQLALLLRSSPVPTTRKRCAALLHRLFSAPDYLFRSLTRIAQNDIKDALFPRLQNEYHQETLVIVCNVVSDIAGDLLPKNQWDVLFRFMFRCLSSNSTHLKHCTLLLFSELIPKCAEVFSPRVDMLHESFLLLMDEMWEEHRVSVAAARAAVQLILYLTTPASHEKYYDLLAYMVRVLFEVLNDEDETSAQKILEDMIVLGGTETGFLRVLIPHLFESMLLIAGNGNFEEKTRQLAIEFVVTVAEDRESGCGMIQSLPERIQQLLNVLMGMLAFIKDDPTWSDANSDDHNAGESSICSYAMESMSRLANALGGNAIVPNFPEVFPEFLKHSDWEKRHAAATALNLISEGCSKVLVNHLDRMMDAMLQLMKDLHPRVRWAAIHAVGQFSKDLSPHLQEQFHQQLVPALILAMDDFDNPRIQTHAASAMLLFSRNCSSTIFESHLNKIVNKLLTFLQKGKIMLKEAALSALASLANSSQEDFKEYYDTVISHAKVFFVTAIDDSNRMLVAKYLECITMVGVAVGRRMFRNDAQKVVEVLILLNESYLETEDPVRTHSLQAWGRLCKCLGSEFLPYLSVAMPQLLHSAEMRNYLSVNENEQNVDDSDDESMVELTAGNSKIRIRESVLEEKALACNILCCFAAELKEKLHLWIHEVVHALVPLISFKFHEDVRAAAVSAMPLMLKSAVSAMKKGLPLTGFSKAPVNSLSDIMIPALLDALNKELKMEICERILEALNECIQISGSHLNKSQVTQAMDGLTELLSDCSYRKKEREKRVKKGLDMRQQELLKEEIEQEEKVYIKIADCLGTFIRTFKESFLPFFDKILPCIALMWHSMARALRWVLGSSVSNAYPNEMGNDKRAEERKVALRIFRDVAEQCQEEAFRYYETSLPFLFKACKDENPDVRQVVACAIGVCAEFGGKAFEPHVEAGLASLKAITEHPSALQPDSVLAYEAAVSALGKICKFHSEQINTVEVVSHWLSHLPIKADLIEAKSVHDQLCSMVEMSEKKVAGPKGANIPKIVKIFAEVLWAGNNLATPETVDRMIKLLKRFHRKFPLSAMETVYSSLPLPQENMLRGILSS